jgi:Outer membrane protein beta-barrel domain
MKRTATGGLLLALLLAALPAYAQEDEYDSGLGELSLNAGFALPLGNATGGNNSTSMSDVINFAVPFGIQLGYRIGGVVFIGGTFSYGAFGSPSSSSFTACSNSGVSCHSSFLRGGVSAQWHPLGSRGLDPYVGLGLGYEWLNVSVSGNGADSSGQYGGFAWLDIPFGVDFRLSKAIRLGPYADFNLGEYRTANISSPSSVSGNISPKAIHFWLSFGVRIVFLSL